LESESKFAWPSLNIQLIFFFSSAFAFLNADSHYKDSASLPSSLLNLRTCFNQNESVGKPNAGTVHPKPVKMRCDRSYQQRIKASRLLNGDSKEVEGVVGLSAQTIAALHREELSSSLEQAWIG
jgi:hypothetical protein